MIIKLVVAAFTFTLVSLMSVNTFAEVVPGTTFSNKF